MLAWLKKLNLTGRRSWSLVLGDGRWDGLDVQVFSVLIPSWQTA
ncbi:MAG: hypothetical protein QOH05_3146 [Acetobacteraceae bacterium]|nr:hypothetical protein [Acetobacteraceae bacterium]